MIARGARSLVVATAAALVAPSTIAATPYRTAGTCAGFPRVELDVPRGWCVALVADQASGLVFPRRTLAWVAPGVLLQGENSIDYPDEVAPAEELNALVAGADYGWPHCVGARQPARGYEGRVDCAKTTAPALLWPAHVAPLQMLAVPVSAQNAFAGQLFVAWHGYRAAGHRVVSYALDARGRASGAPRVCSAAGMR